MEKVSSTDEPVQKKETSQIGQWVLPIAVGATVVLTILNQWLADADVEPATRIGIVIGLVIALAVAVLSALAIIYRRLPQVAGATNFVVLLLVVSVFSVLPAVLLGENERVVALKIGVIVFLSLLPGWLYLQFVAVKGKTLWDEYVLNLFRLHVDDYSHLPRPPFGSYFYSIWEEHKPDEKVLRAETTDEPENLYEAKFRGLYGQTVEHGTDRGINRFQGENLFPVIITTLALAVAWTMALQPEVIMRHHFLPDGTALNALALPGDVLLFGFAGSYFYILQMLVRRYYQDDLKTSAYINATVRVIIVALLVITLHAVWPSDWKGEPAVAFLIGIFPQLGLQALRALIALPLRPLVPSLKKGFPLSDLDGMNIWYESRLLEEGIEDLQNFATANVVDVLLRTRIPVDRLVDWIDQAHLYLHVRKDDGSKKDHELSSREKLRRLGVRTATDLENILKGNNQQYRWVLNKETDPPSITETIFEALRDEPNLHHVRRWKGFSNELETRRNQRSEIVK